MHKNSKTCKTHRGGWGEYTCDKKDILRHNECQDCWLRDLTLSEMKNHIRGKHSPTSKVNHLKMDREKKHIVSSTSYF